MPTLRQRTILSQQARVAELDRLIRECDANRIIPIVSPLSTTYRVFSCNTDSLVASLEDLQDQNAKLWQDDRVELDKAHIEIIRLLHNFLAAAKTLVDHTRVVVQTLYNSTHPFRVEYDERKNLQFKDSNLSHFVHDLRNYALHRRIPVTNATLTVAPARDRLISTVCLSVDSLRQWDGWSRQAKLYLQNLPDKLPLLHVVEPYKKLVSEFNSWMVKRIKEIHSKEFRELDKYRVDRNDLLFLLEVNTGAERMRK